MGTRVKVYDDAGDVIGMFHGPPGLHNDEKFGAAWTFIYNLAGWKKVDGEFVAMNNNIKLASQAEWDEARTFKLCPCYVLGTFEWRVAPPLED